MKRVSLLTLVAATTALGLATAQEMVVCPTGDPTQCVSVTSAGQAPGAPGELVDPLAAAPTPKVGQAWLEWRTAKEQIDPLLPLPGMCALSAGRARYRFSQALLSGNPNRVVESYQWRGKGEDQAEPIIERLLAIPVDGHWERSVIGMWSGPDDTPKKVPIYWRWTNETSTTYFAMRKVDDCWFLEFAGHPGESVVVDGSSVRAAPPNSPPSPLNEPATDPDNPDVLVF